MQHNRALENQNDTLSLMLCLRNPKGTHLYLVERGGVGHCKFTMIDAQLTGLKVNFRTGLNGRFEIVGSCNGLLCITFFEIDQQLVYIANPITGECLMLPSKESTWLLGFGFHSARNEYKVLRADKPLNISSWKVEIQTLGTNAWRQIDEVPLSYIKCLCFPEARFSNILVNGCLHWCRRGHIVALDMGEEKFGVVTTPDSFNESPLSEVLYHLMVWKGYLTVIQGSYGDPCRGSTHIWVMKEYNVKESWTKQVNVKWPIWFPHRCNYWPFDDESFIDDLQSIKHPRYRASSLLKSKSKFKVMPHVGSLLSLKTVAGKERVQNIKFLPGVPVEEDARNV
ncbi:hypothetical protein AAC387_Pa02g4443 [Persea americana]